MVLLVCHLRLNGPLPDRMAKDLHLGMDLERRHRYPALLLADWVLGGLAAASVAVRRCDRCRRGSFYTGNPTGRGEAPWSVYIGEGIFWSDSS